MAEWLLRVEVFQTSLRLYKRALSHYAIHTFVCDLYSTVMSFQFACTVFYRLVVTARAVSAGCAVFPNGHWGHYKVYADCNNSMEQSPSEIVTWVVSKFPEVSLLFSREIVAAPYPFLRPYIKCDCNWAHLRVIHACSTTFCEKHMYRISWKSDKWFWSLLLGHRQTDGRVLHVRRFSFT